MTSPSTSLRLLVVLGVAALVGGCTAAASDSGPGHYGGGGGTSATGTASGTAGNGSTGPGTAGSQGQAGDSVIVTGTGGAGGSGVIMTMTGSAGAFGGGAGTTAGTGTGGGVGGPDGGAQCLITITPVSPGSFTDLEAGDTSVLRLQANVYGYTGGGATADGGGPQWTWSVKMAGASSPADLNYSKVDDAGSLIEFKLGSAGTYQVNARIEGAPMCDRAPIMFVVQPPQTPSLRFRVTPPAGAQLPVHEQLVKSNALDGTPTLDLGDARASEVVSLSPVDARGFPIPSYVRISSPSFAFDVEGYTGRGAVIAALSTGLLYDVLILPDGGLAPMLVSGLPDIVQNQMSLGPGANVTGALRDGNGKPVSGARVLLQFGARPSTVGLSAADGTFALTTREGALSADILPPSGSGLPEARVAASPGIVLLAGMTSLDLAMDWAKVPAAALTIKVSGPGQSAAVVAGARVRVDLATPLANVGTLTVGGATATKLTATGIAHADAVTDAQGLAHLGLLPTGLYHAIVAPPDGMAGAAITLTDVTLPNAGATSPVALAAPVALAGTLTGAGTTAGAKVTAIDRGLLAAATVPTTMAAADGTYKLALAAGRSYELLVEPTAGSGLARSIVGTVTPNGSPRSDAVPPAVTWPGAVTGAGRAIAGALVEVYCVAPAASCIDPSFALAQGTTAADGSITLTLPGPL
jgi:hypothetical protein